MTESRSRLTDAFLGAAFLLLLALLLLIVMSSTARAQPATGAISGTVKLSGGTPVNGCRVYALDSQGPVANATTNASGVYTIDNLPAGSYMVFFGPNDGIHLNQIYNGKTEQQADQADMVTVTPPNTTTHIDAVLWTGATISGTVTSSAGFPITNCAVEAYLVTWNGHAWAINPDAPTRTAYVDSHGRYSIAGLLSAPYKIYFKNLDGWHFSEWYNNKSKPEDSNSVYAVVPNVTSNVNAVLQQGGEVRGNVKWSNGTPITNAVVWPYMYDPASKSWNPVQDRDRVTDSKGNWGCKPLLPGKYRFQFKSPTDDFFPLWYNQKTESAADTVVVEAGKVVTGINATVTLSFTGFVKRDCNDKNHGIAAVKVTALVFNGKGWVEAETTVSKGDGSYLLTNLQAGTYRLFFQSPRPLWSDQYYDNAVSLESAKNIYLAQGQTIKLDVRLRWRSYTCGVYPQSGFSDYATTLTKLGVANVILERGDLLDKCVMDHLALSCIFVNCSTDTHNWDADPDAGPEFDALYNFVSHGGNLYLSDFAGEMVLRNRFPGHVTFANPVEQGSKQKANATATDPDLASYLGKQSVTVTYDKGGWDLMKKVSPSTNVCMKGTVHTENLGTLGNIPLLVSFASGKGKVYYCTFHESVQKDIASRIVSYYLYKAYSKYSWYLAEGSTGGGNETWVLIQNPNNTPANTVVTYMGPQGIVPGPVLRLAPQSRTSVQVSKTFTDYQVSTKVSSDIPVVVERSVFGPNQGWATDSIGVRQTSKTWYLAEGSTNGGMETWVLLLNPNNTPAKVSLTYMTSAGRVTGPTVTVRPNSRTSIYPADTVPNLWDVSTKVTSDTRIVAERAMYWGNRREGHDSIGATAPAKTWYLAEGSTNGGMETWILVQNPNATAATVQLSYMTDKGQVNGPTVSIPAYTRRSLAASDSVPNSWNVSTRITSNAPVVAERSMYGTSGGARTWGTNSIGLTAPAKNWCLAEGCTNGGMETWILVQNPNATAAKVQLSYMTGTGPKPGPTVSVPARSRMTFTAADSVPNNWDVSTFVSSDLNVVVERSMYGNNRWWATNSIGCPL